MIRTPKKQPIKQVRRRRGPVAVTLLCFAAFVAAFAGSSALVTLTNQKFFTGLAINVVDAVINPAFAVEEVMTTEAVPEPEPIEEPVEEESYSVQAVLGAKRHTVIAAGIDARISKLKIENGDRFKKGEILVEYDCSMDYARLAEMQSRQRVTEKQLEAYEKLEGMESASQMEVLMARENNEQNKALVEQISARLKMCRHVAPFNGRVTRKMASQYEYVQVGRVLMDISSDEPLRAEFLIPSKWLRWLNIGTELTIFINETDRMYDAKIVNVHGEVDPVSQSIQVVAEMEDYHEELLPGMSGRAVFNAQTTRNGVDGFLGLMLGPPTQAGDNGTEAE